MKDKKNEKKFNGGDLQKFENGLIPAIIQDFKTGEVLMLAYMDRESLRRSIESKTTWFWSRSRKEYWNKGSSSGNRQIIKEIKYDCDNDTLLVRVDQVGNACHTGARSCFFNKLDISGIADEKDLGKLNFFSHIKPAEKPDILKELYGIIENRIEEKSEDSYTYSLHKKGLKEILKKVGEEGIEVIISSKNESRDRVICEISDLLYHLLVLMVEKRISIDDVFTELISRRKKSGKKNV